MYSGWRRGLGSWPWENSRRWRYAAVRTTFSGYILIHKCYNSPDGIIFQLEKYPAGGGQVTLDFASIDIDNHFHLNRGDVIMPLISCTFAAVAFPRCRTVTPFTLACLLLGAAVASPRAGGKEAARGDHLYHHSGHRPERGG